MTKTPNLNLNLPDFNNSPWHDELNDNFRAIDATIKSIFGLTSLLGSYENSTAVTLGQRYFDSVTGFYYEALSTFTTMPTPTTFAEERAAYPARWQLLDASAAIEAATNAATSANSALSSATSASGNAIAAAASANSAATSATAANTSATNAEVAETNAAASAVDAAASAALIGGALHADQIGVTLQAYDAGLTSIAGLTTAADKLIYTTASDVYATASLTPFARTMLDDADGAAVKNTLGLGNVNNTSDVNKPVSTATQAALNGKLSLSGGTITGDLAIGGIKRIIGGFGAENSTGVLDFNDATNCRSGSGFSLLRGSTAANAPVPGTSRFWHTFNFEFNSNDGTGAGITQFAIPYQNTNLGAPESMYFRTRTNGTWSSWRMIWDTYNGATQAEAEAGTSDAVGMTPLRTAQAISEQALTSHTPQYTSAEQTITAGGLLTLAHGLGAKPSFVQTFIRCKVADSGYAIGDEVDVPNGISDGGNRANSLFSDATNISYRFTNAGNCYVIGNKGTGALAALTNTSWRLIVKAWL